MLEYDRKCYRVCGFDLDFNEWAGLFGYHDCAQTVSDIVCGCVLLTVNGRNLLFL